MNLDKQWDKYPFIFSTQAIIIYPVPQGQRGLLWDWSGQLHHLPPPSVSCITPVFVGGLVYSHAGGEQ